MFFQINLPGVSLGGGGFTSSQSQKECFFTVCRAEPTLKPGTRGQRSEIGLRRGAENGAAGRQDPSRAGAGLLPTLVPCRYLSNPLYFISPCQKEESDPLKTSPGDGASGLDSHVPKPRRSPRYCLIY